MSEGRIISMRQSTRRICRFCYKASDEYGVIYGDPTASDLQRGHDPKINADMDAHQRTCEKNPNRKKAWEFWR